MGKYDSLFDDAPADAPAPAGKYAALFDSPSPVDEDETGEGTPAFLRKKGEPAVADDATPPTDVPSRKFKGDFNAELQGLAADSLTNKAQMGRGLAERARDTAVGIKDTVVGGAKAVAGALPQSLGGRGFLTTIEDPAHRREFERGLSDMITLGYAEKAGNAVSNAFDKPENNLEAHQLSDKANAPDDRALGRVAGVVGPGVVQSTVGKLPGIVGSVGRATGGGLPEYIARTAKSVVGEALPEVTATTRAGAAALGAGKGVAGYAAAAPVTAALSTSATGNRLGTAADALTDPVGLATSAAVGGLAPVVAQAIDNTHGARARRFIEEAGGGAEVTPLSSGKGGVFDRELANVPANDRGVGQAAKIGARQIHDTIEQQFLEDNHFPYREGPKVVKNAEQGLRDAKADARSEARGIAMAHRDDMNAAHNAIRTETAARARQIIDDIEENHKFETSLPYKALKNVIDNKPESITPRDVTPIVTSMQDAVNDLETAPFVRGQLEEQLKILDRYRDPKTQAVMVPERQLNGLRRTLMRAAKVGTTDAPGEAEAPLRKAAFVAKQMVDEGPYKELNDLYAEGAAKREAARKAVGLPGKPSKSAAADEKRLVTSLRRSVGDETAIPGPAPEADVSDLRNKLEATDAAKKAALAKVQRTLSTAEGKRDAVVAHVGEAQKSAVPDRALLGLNDKIGTRKTDVNQTRLALERQVGDNATSGGNPADINAFRAAHPELVTATDLAPLQRAKADLSFHVTPHVGGLAHRILGGAAAPALAYGLMTHPFATAAGLAAENMTPIAGRVLAPLAPGLHTGNPGIPTGRVVGPEVARQSSDRVIAQLIQGAQAGGDPAELTKRAAAFGVDPVLAQQIIAKWAPQPAQIGGAP